MDPLHPRGSGSEIRFEVIDIRPVNRLGISTGHVVVVRTAVGTVKPYMMKKYLGYIHR
jgi:hypothetical protein